MKKLTILILSSLILSSVSCSSSKKAKQNVPLSRALSLVSEVDSLKQVASSDSKQYLRLQRILRDVKINFNSIVYDTPNLECFVIDNQLRISSSLIDLMRNDEVLSLIIKEYAHQEQGHYLPRLNSGFDNSAEFIFNTRFSESETRIADAYTLQYFADNSLNLQSVVNTAYKLSSIYEKNASGSKSVEFSPSLINSSSKIRARAIAAMLEEYKLDRNYFAGILNTSNGQTNRVVDTPQQAVTKAPIRIPSNTRNVIGEPAVAVAGDLNANAQVDDLFRSDDRPEIIKTMKPKSASLKFNNNFNRNQTANQESSGGKFRASSGWYLQVSAENSLSEAKNKILQLEQDNLSCVIQDIKVNGNTLYRILIGPYSNEITARSKSGQSSLISADAFTRYIEN